MTVRKKIVSGRPTSDSKIDADMGFKMKPVETATDEPEIEGLFYQYYNEIEFGSAGSTGDTLLVPGNDITKRLTISHDEWRIIDNNAEVLTAPDPPPDCVGYFELDSKIHTAVILAGVSENADVSWSLQYFFSDTLISTETLQPGDFSVESDNDVVINVTKNSITFYVIPYPLNAPVYTQIIASATINGVTTNSIELNIEIKPNFINIACIGGGSGSGSGSESGI